MTLKVTILLLRNHFVLLLSQILGFMLSFFGMCFVLFFLKLTAGCGLLLFRNVQHIVFNFR